MVDLVGYFGFGSLVNKHTLRTSYVNSVPARLKGWRRHWQGRTVALDHDVALLSIHQDESCIIDGMLVVDRLENLPLVDEREVGYARHRLTLDDVEILGEADLPTEFYVYVAHQPNANDNGRPLLQSYLDAVMQGFRNEFGDEGVARFVETTFGFERALINDRHDPLYPRSVALTEEETDLFDRTLDGIVLKTPERAQGI